MLIIKIMLVVGINDEICTKFGQFLYNFLIVLYAGVCCIIIMFIVVIDRYAIKPRFRVKYSRLKTTDDDVPHSNNKITEKFHIKKDPLNLCTTTTNGTSQELVMQEYKIPIDQC